MKVWRIRTKDGRPIMFDESVQILPDGGATEFNFTIEKMAKAALLQLRINNPKDEFVLIEEELDTKDVAWTINADEIHEKALEENNTHKA